MKNRIGTGLYFCLAAILLGIGPNTIFKVCRPGETYMKCWWSTQAEIAIAILLAVIGIGIFVFQSKQVRFGMSLVGVAIGVMAILIPGLLIGGCMNPTMACRSITFPCIYVIATITILVALVNSIYLYQQMKKEQV